MSKKIDFSKPLSEDDAAYVAERPWLAVDAQLSGFDLSDETDFSVDEEDSENPDGFEDGDDADGQEGDGDESTDDESDEEGEDDEEDEGVPYSEWDYADLKTEAGERGLSKSGSKEQLIERLEANDAESAE